MGQREREVRGAATAVLDEVGQSSIPIDPFDVARRKGIPIEERSGLPPGIFGAMYKDATGFGIVISTACHGPGHRVFTAAHELGHYHIEGHLDEMFAEGTGQVLSVGGHFRSRKDPKEREADWFASELLAPRALAGPVARDLPGTIDDLSLFADRFGVSLVCAGVRYAELTDAAVAVVISREGGIEWVAFSERMREHAWSQKAWRKESVPAGTATARLGEGRQPDTRQDGRSLLCEWFEGAPADLSLEEECLWLSSYGRVITMLSAPDLPSVDEVEEETQESEWRERDWRDAVRGFELD